jgi:rhamnosyltransferase
MKNGVCAIIVTYNIGKELSKCFDSIKDQVEEVTIVDNGSEEETLSVLNDLEARGEAKIFHNTENLGIAAALNTGIRHAAEKTYKWVLTLDHDSEATPGMVERLLDANKALAEQGRANVGIISARSFDRNISRDLNEKKYPGLEEDVKEEKIVMSSGSMINTRVFGEVGFYNESLFMYYVDDDFCLRCLDKGWEIYVCGAATLFHQEGMKEGRRFLWKKFAYKKYDHKARYYISRNAIYMLKKHPGHFGYCFQVALRLIGNFFQILLYEQNRGRLLQFATKGILDGFAGKYGKLVTA